MQVNLIKQWTSRMDHVTQAVSQACGTCDPAALQVRPGSGQWSAAEVLEHIMTLNTSYFPLFDKILAGTFRPPLVGRLPLLPRWFGRMILRSVKPDTTRKSKTLSIWQPVDARRHFAGATEFLKHQEMLKDYFLGLTPMLDGNVVIHSPAGKGIVYPLKDALEILVTHEERHLLQFYRALETAMA